jgi:gag-polypeptide of LTR copia-type
VELLSAVFDDISFNTVDKARSTTFPDGNCALAWNGLLRIFEPTTSASKVALKKKFSQMKLTDPQVDPSLGIIELESICQRLRSLKGKINNDNFVIHILNNLLKEYDSVVKNIEENMDQGLLD